MLVLPFSDMKKVVGFISIYVISLLLSGLIFFGCRKSDNNYKHGPTFITSPGRYFYQSTDKKTLEIKSINVCVKEFKDGGLVYGVSDLYNRPLYQHSMFRNFSNYQAWIIYVPNVDTIWHYNSDLQESVMLIRKDNPDEYTSTEVRYQDLPEVMRKELD